VQAKVATYPAGPVLGVIVYVALRGTLLLPPLTYDQVSLDVFEVTLAVQPLRLALPVGLTTAEIFRVEQLELQSGFTAIMPIPESSALRSCALRDFAVLCVPLESALGDGLEVAPEAFVAC